MSRAATIKKGTLTSYSVGFGVSVLFTLDAYYLVAHRAYSRDLLIFSVVGLALVQFLVQVILFLHLGGESKPRLRLFALMLMIIIVTILVGGSLWIMSNLNYHMSPQQINQYMNNQDGF